jgi:hypothetical protein
VAVLPTVRCTNHVELREALKKLEANLSSDSRSPSSSFAPSSLLAPQGGNEGDPRFFIKPDYGGMSVGCRALASREEACKVWRGMDRGG